MNNKHIIDTMDTTRIKPCLESVLYNAELTFKNKNVFNLKN